VFRNFSPGKTDDVDHAKRYAFTGGWNNYYIFFVNALQRFALGIPENLTLYINWVRIFPQAGQTVKRDIAKLLMLQAQNAAAALVNEVDFSLGILAEGRHPVTTAKQLLRLP
jgi:hypothetical protein